MGIQQINQTAIMNSLMNGLGVPTAPKDEYSREPSVRDKLRSKFNFGELLNAALHASG